MVRAHRGYQEIADALRQRIAAGDLRPGGRLPGEESLAAEFGVARGTARAALQQLEAAGLVAVVPGRGRYVAIVGGPSVILVEGDAGAAYYEQVAAHVRDLIKRERRKPGDPLPSENELRSELGVSRNTVRRAYELLVSDGLVVRRQGMGAFVADVRG